jgi:uncharacterized protein YacL
MGLLLLRCVFVIVAAGFGVSLLNNPKLVPTDSGVVSWTIFFSVIGLALVVIGIDIALRKKHLETITAIYFGMIVGLFMTYILGLALEPMLIGYNAQVRDVVKLMMGMVLCYTCISLLLQTRSDFRFIIPYVEFAKEIKGVRPCVLDTSVIIDGRIADVAETNIIDGKLIIPKFVITELQSIADSQDRLRRGRGRRGLDILNRLRTTHAQDIEIFEQELTEFGNQPVDLKLVILAKHLQGKLITNDYNLNKVAKLHGVPVINFNDLSNALKPVFLPGEHFDVRIVKAGEEQGQGVGYLEDGTMVVIENGRDHIGETINIGVTSVLQTSAGRMVFGKC